MTDALATWRATIEDALARAVRAQADDGRAPPARLVAAMEHSLLAGGKRLRPTLVMSCAAALADAGHAERDALPAAVAVEYVHTYSLIHDDLPALDDDDVRRGRPSLHKAFDEATAILAGDALLTDAFALLARAPKDAAAQVLELALAAGSAGMVGGQHDDVVVRADTVEALADVHARKTGRLFVASCALGGIAVGARADAVVDLREYGRRFGLAFQIMDDVLDVKGFKGGAQAGRDARRQKVTFATLLGIDAAAQRAKEESEAAAEIAVRLRAPVLVELARFSAGRDR